MRGFISDRPLARELIRIGDEAIAPEDDDKLRACFRDELEPELDFPRPRYSLSNSPRVNFGPGPQAGLA